MPADVKWVMERMEEYAPPRLALDWDNVGLMAGRYDKKVSRILLALDVTDTVIEEAVSFGADMIITHHPLIFKPISAVTSETAQGRKLLELIERGIACFAAHTNLDRALGGTNDTLFDILGLTGKEHVDTTVIGEPGLGRAGYLPAPMGLGNFADMVQKALGLNNIRYCGDAAARVRKIGLCAGGGAAAKYAEKAAEAGCDCYVTGDMGYHDAQAILDMGMVGVDATHFATEAPTLAKLKDYLGGRARESGFDMDITISAARDYTASR